MRKREVIGKKRREGDSSVSEVSICRVEMKGFEGRVGLW